MSTILGRYSSTYHKGCEQVSFPDTNTNAAVDNTGFSILNYLIRKPNPKGSFQCAIPLRGIFGFVDDSKVTYGMQLIRRG